MTGAHELHKVTVVSWDIETCFQEGAERKHKNGRIRKPVQAHDSLVCAFSAIGRTADGTIVKMAEWNLGQFDNDEKKLLDRIADWLYDITTLEVPTIGYNSHNFDIPFVGVRLLIGLEEQLFGKDWNRAFSRYTHTDLFYTCRRVAPHLGLKSFPRQDDIMVALGVERPSDNETTGADVESFVLAEEWDLLSEYCTDDCLKTLALYDRLCDLGLLKRYRNPKYADIGRRAIQAYSCLDLEPIHDWPAESEEE